MQRNVGGSGEQEKRIWREKKKVGRKGRGIGGRFVAYRWLYHMNVSDSFWTPENLLTRRALLNSPISMHAHTHRTYSPGCIRNSSLCMCTISVLSESWTVMPVTTFILQGRSEIRTVLCSSGYKAHICINCRRTVIIMVVLKKARLCRERGAHWCALCANVAL